MRLVSDLADHWSLSDNTRIVYFRAVVQHIIYFARFCMPLMQCNIRIDLHKLLDHRVNLARLWLVPIFAHDLSMPSRRTTVLQQQ